MMVTAVLKANDDSVYESVQQIFHIIKTGTNNKGWNYWVVLTNNNKPALFVTYTILYSTTWVKCLCPSCRRGRHSRAWFGVFFSMGGLVRTLTGYSESNLQLPLPGVWSYHSFLQCKKQATQVSNVFFHEHKIHSRTVHSPFTHHISFLNVFLLCSKITL